MNIFGTSIPKSGTHLLVDIFERMGYETLACRKVGRVETLPEEFDVRTDKPCYIYAHYRAKEQIVRQIEGMGLPIVVMIRDPRDICLSMADFLHSGRPKSSHRLEPSLSKMTRRELIIGTILGFNLPGYPTRPMSEICRGWLEWSQHGALVVRYEDVVNSVLTGEPMLDWSVLDLCPARVLEATVASYKRSGTTFNRGEIERWRDEFDDELQALWREHVGDVTSLLGYPGS